MGKVGEAIAEYLGSEDTEVVDELYRQCAQSGFPGDDLFADEEQVADFLMKMAMNGALEIDRDSIQPSVEELWASGQLTFATGPAAKAAQKKREAYYRDNSNWVGRLASDKSKYKSRPVIDR